MDVLAVRDATTEAIRSVREGKGPVFLEAMTYRFRGHSMSDPSAYRASLEVDQWRTRDPIDSFKAMSLGEELITAEEIIAIDQEVEAVVQQSVRFADESPNPDLPTRFNHVYA